MVQNMLINKHAKTLLEDLNRQFLEIETFQKVPEYYMGEVCGELIRQVDLRRERLFESIGQQSDLLIQKIDAWKRGLLTKTTENDTSIVEEKTIECKKRLDQLNLMFESLKIDNNKLEEIASQKESKALAKLLKQIAGEYRRALIGRKMLVLKTNDIEMEKVFGMLRIEELSKEATFQLVIEDFSKFKDAKVWRLSAQPCIVHNLPWKILTKATEKNDIENSLGFYLQCNANSDSTRWSVFAVVELRVLHNTDPELNYVRKYQHLFNLKETDWGYFPFIPMKEIMDPERGE